jgi:hypothetical protein
MLTRRTLSTQRVETERLKEFECLWERLEACQKELDQIWAKRFPRGFFHDRLKDLLDSTPIVV